jgi:hypothetical protein
MEAWSCCLVCLLMANWARVLGVPVSIAQGGRRSADHSRLRSSTAWSRLSATMWIAVVAGAAGGDLGHCASAAVRGEKVDPVVPRLFHGDKPPRRRPEAASS